MTVPGPAGTEASQRGVLLAAWLSASLALSHHLVHSSHQAQLFSAHFVDLHLCRLHSCSLGHGLGEGHSREDCANLRDRNVPEGSASSCETAGDRRLRADGSKGGAEGLEPVSSSRLSTAAVPTS